jgi:hypothetical protein
MTNQIPSNDEMWIQAVQLRVEDMLKTHQEIDEKSLALLVDTLGAGLRSSNKLLQAYQAGSSFLESDYFDIDPEDESQDNTKLGTRKRTATKVSHVLSNGRTYSITGPYFNSHRSRMNGNR